MATSVRQDDAGANGRQEKGYQYHTFDDPNLAAIAQEDPVGFIDRLSENVIFDEVQPVPGLFTSIKRSVDQNRKPGRFLLTGSANVLLLPSVRFPGRTYGSADGALAGDNFIAGRGPYDGDMILPFGESLFAMPVRALWSARERE